jgi:hypothetical protein
MDNQIPVKVALRCRPLVAKERNEGCRVSLWKNFSNLITDCQELKLYRFLYVEYIVCQTA